MDKINKLLKKLSQKEGVFLERVIDNLLSGKVRGLNIKKIGGANLYRLSVKRLKIRIIFHFKNSEVVVDQIRLKDKNTYKNLPKK